MSHGWVYFKSLSGSSYIATHEDNISDMIILILVRGKNLHEFRIEDRKKNMRSAVK